MIFILEKKALYTFFHLPFLLLASLLLLLFRETLESSLLALTGVLDVGAGHGEGLVAAALLHVSRDLGAFNLADNVTDWHDLSVNVLFDIGAGALLENDKLASVLLESLYVGLESFLALVLSSLVNADAELLGLGGAQAAALDFIVSETSADSLFGVVSEGWALDDWSKATGQWSWRDSDGLGGASGSPSALLGWLVEPGLGELGPRFSIAEMRVG